MLQFGLSSVRAPLTKSVLKRATQTISSRSFHQSKIFRQQQQQQQQQANNNTHIKVDHSQFLPWNEFLAKRLQRRRMNLAASVFTGILGIGAGWAVIANVEIDPTQPILGMDPLIMLPIGVVLCGTAGALCGPSLGSLLFKWTVLGKKQNVEAFMAQNAEFLRHVKRNRPDPSKQTYANPVPDYYGEKIGSLKDYRTWLRDGRAYRRKVETFL